MTKHFNQDMSSTTTPEEEFRRKHFRVTEEELTTTSVKIAMECLHISNSSSSPTDGTDHCSDRQLGGDCKTDKQIDRQMTDKTSDTESMATSHSSEEPIVNSYTREGVVAEDITNDINREETIEGYNSDSVYDSSSETEYIDKSEFSENPISDKSCEVNEEKKNVVNAVNGVSGVTESKEGVVVSKYPLKYKWNFWFWKPSQGVKVVWHKALQRVGSPFDTVDDFWRLYHHIIPVKQLVSPSDYCVFKEGISPMWEDSHNINGGKWTLDFRKGANRSINPHLDEIWLEVLLCLIGEGFNEFGEDICGAVVNIRSKEDRISVWTANANKSVSNLKIGEILKIRSGYEGKLKYEAHTTAQRIAEAKDRLFDSKLLDSSKPKPKPIRRSCAF